MAKRILIPGDMISETPLKMKETIVQDGKTYATVMGVYDDVKKSFLPLESLWFPGRSDVVIGIIDSARLNSYGVDLNSLYKGIVISKYEETKFNIGDVIEATVRELDETNTVVLQYPKLLSGGKIIDVRASKIPRLIGKDNTMIKELTEGTHSMVKVGMNGRVWIKGGDITLATEAIIKIQQEAHTSGLTNRVKAMLQKSNVSKGNERTEEEEVEQ